MKMPNQVDIVRKMLKRPIKMGKNIFHEGVTGLRAPAEIALDGASGGGIREECGG
jgi:hypothetical protein